jgi:hypothetical protein
LKINITERFNSSAAFSNNRNMNIFDQVIGRVVANEQEELAKFQKPYIQELDDANP